MAKTEDKKPLDYHECHRGTLVDLHRRSGFKIAIITGYTRTGKVRVRVWSDNSRCWSNPQSKRADELHAIDGSQLSSRHLAVFKRAKDNALTYSSEVLS